MSWMTKAQTAGKTMPYMYSQCEDINCRSIVPVQDTPSNKVTYSARVETEKGYVVKMSANQTDIEMVDENTTAAYFLCEIPIANYLMAIAAGDIVYKSLGNRVGVFTEPTEMPKCANELADMGEYLNKTEAYLTPYIWGNYSILVLPPSFPMGGMENPLLTFASPTIIVGDKS